MNFLYSITILPIETIYHFLYLSFYGVTQSLIFSLILMSLVSGIIFYPFRLWSNAQLQKELKIRSILEPQLKHIQQQTKGAERHGRISRLYSRYSYHPIMGIRSSFGILFQVPFIIAAYEMITHLSLFQGSSTWLISDLSKPDRLIFGFNLLPILMTIFNLLAVFTNRLMQKADRLRGIALALLFLVFLYPMPSALMIFWTSNNFISFIQNFIPQFTIPKNIKQKVNQFWNLEIFESFLVLSFPALVTFIVLPAHVYLTNRIEFEFKSEMFLFFLVPASASIFLSIMAVIFLKKFFKNHFFFLERVSFAIAVSLLLCNFLLAAPSGFLDGAPTVSKPGLISSLSGILICVSVFAFIFKNIQNWVTWKWRKIVPVAIFILSFFMVFFSVSLKPSKIENSNFVSTTIQLPNLYLIHLDAGQSDFALKIIKENDLEAAFQGFKFFIRNVSNFTYTTESVSSYSTGKIPKAQTIDKWISEIPNGFLKNLREQGYQLTYYGDLPLYPHGIFDKVTSSQSVLFDHVYMPSYVQVWFSRLLPNFLIGKAFHYGNKLGAWITQAYFNENLDRLPTEIMEGVEPYSGLKLLERLVEDEQKRPNHGQFVHVRAVIPHSPWLIGPNCEYQKGIVPSGNAPSRYYNQYLCALRQVVRFLTVTKTRQYYDSSFFIIMGDHGEGWVGQLKDLKGLALTLDDASSEPFDKEIHPWSKANLEGRFRALMMLKGPGSNYPFTVSKFPSQLLDVMPTLLDAANLAAPPQLEGISLLKQNLNEFENRKRILRYGRPSAPYASPLHIFEAQFDEGNILNINQVESK